MIPIEDVEDEHNDTDDDDAALVETEDIIVDDDNDEEAGLVEAEDIIEDDDNDEDDKAGDNDMGADVVICEGREADGTRLVKIGVSDGESDGDGGINGKTSDLAASSAGEQEEDEGSKGVKPVFAFADGVVATIVDATHDGMIDNVAEMAWADWVEPAEVDGKERDTT